MQKVYPIHTVVPHLFPHVDEMAARWLLNREGEELYPGIKDAKTEFYQTGKHDDGRPEEAWLEEGVLFLGVREGHGDHHPHDEYPDDCTFTLFLRRLGLHNHPLFIELQKEILFEDTKGKRPILHLAQDVKRMHKANWDFNRIVHHVNESLDVNLWTAHQYCKATKIVHEQREKFFVFETTPDGVKVWLCVIPMNPVLQQNKELWRAASTRPDDDTPGADLVIMCHPSNQFQIFGNARQGIHDLAPLAAAIRAEQLKVDCKAIPPLEELRGEGSLKTVPRFYYQSAMPAIFNGSLTRPDVLPTTIPRVQLLKLCRRFLRNYTGPVTRFDPSAGPSGRFRLVRPLNHA